VRDEDERSLDEIRFRVEHCSLKGATQKEAPPNPPKPPKTPPPPPPPPPVEPLSLRRDES